MDWFTWFSTNHIRDLAMRQLFRKQKLTAEILYLQPRTSQPFVRMAFTSLLNPQIYSVAAMTVGNGFDNIATYIPLFATENFIGMEVLIGFFFLLLGLWCYIGYTLVSFPAIASITKRYGYVFLPFVFITLGILIMIEAGILI